MAVLPCRIRNQRMMILKLDSNDKFIEDAVFSTTRTFYSKFTKVVALSFSPPSTGDYLILAYTRITTGSTTETTWVKLDYSSTAYGEAAIDLKLTSDVIPWMTMQRFNLTTGTKTFTVHVKSGGGATVSVATTKIVALRLDSFKDDDWARSSGLSTTSSSVYVDKTTLTSTPTANPYMIMGSGIMSMQGVGRVKSRLIEGTEVIDEFIIDPATTEADYPYVVLDKRNEINSSTTWKTQVATGGSGTAEFSDSSIAIINLAIGDTTVALKGGAIKGKTLIQ